VSTRGGSEGTLVGGPDESAVDAEAHDDGRTGDEPPRADDESGEPVAGTGGGRGAAVAVAAITAVLAIPIVVAAIAVRSTRWYPLIDLAQIELRVRDVGPGHPPLVGLGGRIFGLDTQGAHPGPVSFYLLAPVYRLLGGSSWALQASAATLNVAALAATVWAVHRRWGLRGALLVAAGLALVMRMYGTVVLLYPWNPYLPVLFWTLFLVCVWGVLCDDMTLLPVAVVAGSLCAQTHLPYVGIVGGLAVVVVVALALAYRRAGDHHGARRRLVRWSAASLALAAVIWLPVFVEQLGGDPGNLSIIADSLRHSDEPSVGLGPAWSLLVEHLNPVRLVEGERGLPAPRWPGLVLLAAWLSSAVASVRLRDRTLIRLHVVVAAAVVLGLVSISRILGVTWFYLTLWAFGTAMLALLAVVATAAAVGAALLARRPGAGRAARLWWAPFAALGLGVLVPTLLLAREAPDTADVDAPVSEQLGRVVQPTVDALEDGTVPGDGDGTYLVTWVDPVNLGGQGMGLLLELERRGYDTRAPASLRLAVRAHRVAAPAEADAQIHVATGVAAIAEARAHPGGRQIAYHDPRTDAERAEYDRLRSDVVASLEASGLDELVPKVDANFIAIAADERTPDDVQLAIYVMGRMPQPLGVYTWDPMS
jgi:hypothetical protein